VARIITESPQGISVIIGPDGMPIAETQAEEDVILSATVDLDALVVPKQFHDVVGYYNRFDIFQLNVNRSEMAGVHFDDGGSKPRSLDFEQMERILGTDSTAEAVSTK